MTGLFFGLAYYELFSWNFNRCDDLTVKVLIRCELKNPFSGIAFHEFIHFGECIRMNFAYFCFVKFCLQFVFLILIVAGSIGVPVYQHTCNETSEVENAILVNTTNCHEDGHEDKEKSCCSEKEAVSTDDCCTDEVSAYKVSFFKSEQQKLFLDLAVLPDFNISSVLSTEDGFSVERSTVLAFSDLPPPKLSKRLAQLQVWRI